MLQRTRLAAAFAILGGAALLSACPALPGQGPYAILGPSAAPAASGSTSGSTGVTASSSPTGSGASTGGGTTTVTTPSASAGLPSASPSASGSSVPTASASATAGARAFTLNLTPGAEVPAPTAATTATGTGTFQLSADQKTATVTVNFSGLSSMATGAHVHQGAAGQTGLILKELVVQTSNPAGTAGTATATWTASDATKPFDANALSALMAGNLYVNVHTQTNAAGEIRAQVIPQ